MKSLVVTLSFIREGDRLLLAFKKRGFGQGKWNGYGGKVIVGETIIEAAIREIQEEATIEVKELAKRGLINFFWPSHKFQPIECHLFEIINYEGEPSETEEMKPRWFSINDLPYNEMWADDPHWLPHFLEDKKFNASFVFNDADEVIKHTINFEK